MDFLNLLPAYIVPAVEVNIGPWNQYVDLLVAALDWPGDDLPQRRSGDHRLHHHRQDVMLPLTVKSIRSSKAMQELQPKIKELQKKHGKDRQRVSQETMALYQQYQVNPMAGCLPMLIQIPIFLGPLPRDHATSPTSGAGLCGTRAFSGCPAWRTPTPGTSCRSWPASSSSCRRR